MSKNKLGITNGLELAREEERISKSKAMELFLSGELESYQAGTFESLQKIHKVLFEDIYNFAGKVRAVNLSKGNFRFASELYLDVILKTIEKMPQSNFDEIIEKYVEMNVAHPFREGNGRSTRIWLEQILQQELGLCIDWSLVDKDEYLLAMERSPVRDLEIKHILRDALVDVKKLSPENRKSVFMRGLDASYYYEGYESFRTDSLVKASEQKAARDKYAPPQAHTLACGLGVLYNSYELGRRLMRLVDCKTT